MIFIEHPSTAVRVFASLYIRYASHLSFISHETIMTITIRDDPQDAAVTDRPQSWPPPTMGHSLYLPQYWIQTSIRSERRPARAFRMEVTESNFPQLSMQQAVLTHFPNVDASYRFTNRTLEDTFTRKCFELFKKSVRGYFSLGVLNSSNTIAHRIREAIPIS